MNIIYPLQPQTSESPILIFPDKIMPLYATRQGTETAKKYPLNLKGAYTGGARRA